MTVKNKYLLPRIDNLLLSWDVPNTYLRAIYGLTIIS